ncbi:SIR2 family protein [Bacillus infantis]|uniref:SIR2 family protein n=1 Tax=Bacillus infantis TaxID=324767 RepID=UPI003CF59E07
MHDFDEGLIHLQGFLKKSPMLVVGTGLSLSMGLPGMGELLTHLKKRIPLSCTMVQLEEWENCLTLIDQHGFEEGLGKITVSDNLLNQIVNETADLVGAKDSEFASKLSDYQVSDLPFARFLQHLIQSLHPLNPILHIVTPNYDQLVEYSCDLIGVNCVTGFHGSHFMRFNANKLSEDLYRTETVFQKGKKTKDFRKVPTVKLLKPHGSLSWHRIGENTFQSHKIIPQSSRVIITPGNSKYKASLTDNVMNYHREMANECIKDAESVVIIGYGFNDSHLQTVLNDKIKSGTDCLILTKWLSDGAKKFVSDFKHVIALEEHDSLGTRWYYNGEQGTWGEPMWDLNHFVKKVIGA